MYKFRNFLATRCFKYCEPGDRALDGRCKTAEVLLSVLHTRQCQSGSMVVPGTTDDGNEESSKKIAREIPHLSSLPTKIFEIKA